MTGPTYARVRAVFVEVCDLQGAEREAALERLCGGDASLRAAVVKLLDRDTTEADLLDERAVMTGAIFGGSKDPGEHQTPAAIGGYRILRVIGEGGMGTVYEAEQRDPQRIIALKVLHRWSVSSSLVRRFRRETQVLGRLQHPGIAQIYEAGVHDPRDGSAAVPFFVMELVRGKPLTAFVGARDLPHRDRLGIFVLVCTAVAYAHQRGVIHRDLKPDNILVDEDGRPKVIDFGIATSTTGDDPVTTVHTTPGQIIGTIPYMSPEQVGGDPTRIDARSDVYSLGVLLYETLTGRLPHDLRDRSLPDAVRVIREESHTRLSSVNRLFRGDLETIVTKALEKDPDRRYQSVAELAADIRRHLNNEPIAARPPSAFYQLTKFASRNKAVVAGVAGIMIALGMGAAAATKFAFDALAREKEERWSSYRARIEAASAAIERDDMVAAQRHLDEAPPEFRSWEWHHLHRNTDQWSARITSPSPIVGEIMFLSDGARVAGIASDNRLRIWDVSTGQVEEERPIDATVIAVDAAPYGPLFVVATSARDVRLLEAESGNEVDRWTDAPEGILGTDLTSDGHRIIARSADSITVWDRRRREVLWSRQTHTSADEARGHTSLSANSDGTTVAVATGYPRNTFLISSFDIETGAPVVDHRSPENGSILSFRPYHDELAVGSNLRDTRILDGGSLAIDRRWPGHTRAISALAYSPKGDRIATGSHDATVRVRDASDGQMLRMYTLREAATDASALAFSPDGSRLAILAGSLIAIGDLRSEHSKVLRSSDRYVYCVAFSPDGSLLASSSYGPSVARLWDGVSGEEVAVLGEAPSPHALRFSRDGSRLLAAAAPTADCAWDIASGAIVTPRAEDADLLAEDRMADAGRIVRDPTGTFEAMHPVSQATFGRGARPASVDERTARIRRVGEAASIRAWTFESVVACVAFLADRRTVLIGLASGDIAVMDIEGDREIDRLRGHRDFVYSIAVSPDGRRVASGGNDNSLRLWDTATWDQVFERHSHSAYIYTVAFSPDGTRIATASGDGSIRLWDSVRR